MSGKPEKFDVVIVGGGPAGMSAALWSVDNGLCVALIERERSFGGQLNAIHNPIRNYLGLEAPNGSNLSSHFMSSIESLPIQFLTGVPVDELDVDNKMAILSDARRVEGNVLVLATGVRRRKLGIPGESEFNGRGVMASGAGECESATGKSVVIVGGGDAAIENALLLSTVAKEVTVVHRGSAFTARSGFVVEAHRRSNIRFLFNSVPTSIEGFDAVREVVVSHSDRDGAESTIPTDLVLIRIGVVPNSELVEGKVGRDGQGYILVDPLGATSKAWIFAVGDVANPASPTISTATGTAASAIKAIKQQIQLNEESCDKCT